MSFLTKMPSIWLTFMIAFECCMSICDHSYDINNFKSNIITPIYLNINSIPIITQNIINDTINDINTILPVSQSILLHIYTNNNKCINNDNNIDIQFCDEYTFNVILCNNNFDRNILKYKILSMFTLNDHRILMSNDSNTINNEIFAQRNSIKIEVSKDQLFRMIILFVSIIILVICGCVTLMLFCYCMVLKKKLQYQRNNKKRHNEINKFSKKIKDIKRSRSQSKSIQCNQDSSDEGIYT